MLNVDRYESGAVTVLRLEGDIDEDGIGALRFALTGCLQDGRCSVVLNCAAVKFVSYMGVGVFVERLRQLREGGGDLRLAGLNLYTTRLLRMAGVQHLFQAYDAEFQAIESFRRAA